MSLHLANRNILNQNLQFVKVTSSLQLRLYWFFRFPAYKIVESQPYENLLIMYTFLAYNSAYPMSIGVSLI
ncbi:hypothetical protein Bcoa_1453 [Heyndrickxia coagulans 36D1]|uniref:Uncharacterized protein n=1 Tax=Heyndrickxia coagulans 36D1 TaxID=345219 RepID=G2THU1_HEYCO|nr:hypothetical protein Bcoa_1453 [Heyndrickxia coagulans 36D1]